MCEPGSAVAKLIREANLGLAIPVADSMRIVKAIEDWIRIRDEAGELSFQPNVQILEQYSLQKGVMPLIVKKLNEAVAGIS